MAIAEVSQSVSRSLREPDLSEVIVDPRRSDFHIQELVADRDEGPAARLRRHCAVCGFYLARTALTSGLRVIGSQQATVLI